MKTHLHVDGYQQHRPVITNCGK